MDRIAEGFLACNAALHGAKAACSHLHKEKANRLARPLSLRPFGVPERGRSKGAFWLEIVRHRVGHEDRLALGSTLLLLERLVGPKADDGQSQRIDGQLVVLDLVPEDIGHASGPLLTLEHGVVRWVREYSLELNSR